jgi:Fe(3+) dicitrate transport protein
VFAGVHRGFSPAPPGEPSSTPPETAWNAEIGARALPGAASMELTAFGSRYDNIQGQCSLSAGCVEADLDRAFTGGAAWVAGVEAAASHVVPLPGALSARFGATYTWTWSAFADGFVSTFPLWGAVSRGDRLPYVPEHQATAELAAEAPFGHVSLFGVYRGEMRDVAGQGPVDAAAALPAAFTLDLAVEGRLTPNVRAYALARNLTGTAVVESLRPFGARPGGPFTVMAGVKVGAAGPGDGGR